MEKVTRRDIEEYLSEVKEAIRNDQYRIEMNRNRQENINLFWKYVLDEEKAKEILLSLTASDFSEKIPNKHPGYEYEFLYVFGKNIKLLERTGDREKNVSLYIKINKVENGFVFVISFHEQRFPLRYYFNDS